MISFKSNINDISNAHPHGFADPFLKDYWYLLSVIESGLDFDYITCHSLLDCTKVGKQIIVLSPRSFHRSIPMCDSYINHNGYFNSRLHEYILFTISILKSNIRLETLHNNFKILLFDYYLKQYSHLVLNVIHKQSIWTTLKEGVRRNHRGCRGFKNGFMQTQDPLEIFFRSNAAFLGFRILKRILYPSEGFVENYKTFKKDCSTFNKSNRSILGWYETLRRVSTDGFFFQCTLIDRKTSIYI